jgi:hypothetical protein
MPRVLAGVASPSGIDLCLDGSGQIGKVNLMGEEIVIQLCLGGENLNDHLQLVMIQRERREH